jgi:hypothetical protein
MPNMSLNLPLENSAEIGQKVLQRMTQQHIAPTPEACWLQKEITSFQNLAAQPFTLHMLEKSIQYLKEMIFKHERP